MLNPGSWDLSKVYNPGQPGLIRKTEPLTGSSKWTLNRGNSCNGVGRDAKPITESNNRKQLLSLGLQGFKNKTKHNIELLEPRSEQCSIEIETTALAGVAQLVGHHPTQRKVTNSLPGQGTCSGCWFSAPSGHVWKSNDWCFSLTLMCLDLSFSFPSPISQINK